MHNTNSSNVRNRKFPLRTFGIFGIALLLTVTCTWWFTRNYYQQNSAMVRAISSLDSSLINCNNLIQKTNNAILYEMEGKLEDPGRKEKALIWNPKAKSALSLTQNIQEYIRKLKSEITGASDYKRFGSKEAFYRPQISDGLFDSLNNFNFYLTDLIPPNKIEQLGVLPVQSLTSSEQTINKNEWYQRNFGSIDKTATLAMLSKIEADVLCSTNILLEYINNQSESLIQYDEFYLPLVSQNTTVLLPGQTLEITAGIGAYIHPSNPTIQINKNYIPVDDEGVGVYKQIVGNEKDGSIVVTISYKDPNTGQLRVVSKSINYSVFQPFKK